jgi:predicted transposase YbfD/YdcC
MATRKIARNAATPKGFLRRVGDCEFEKVDDPRHDSWVKHPLAGMLKLGTLALASRARSTRSVEARSTRMHPKVRKELKLKSRIADNTFGQTLPDIDWQQCRRGLHRQVKAEWRRGNLRPSQLNKSTVAIDGKHLATVPERRLRGMVSREAELDGDELTVTEMQRIFRWRYPYVQLQEAKEGLRGMVRAHRATLVSSGAAVTLDQWPVAGKTNEWTTIESTLSTLLAAYGRTQMVQRVTLDAGNATPKAASLLNEESVDYLMALKSPQSELYDKARTLLKDRPGSQADYDIRIDERGKMICYSVWQTDLDGPEGFAGGRQLVRIERVVASDDGDVDVGNRYFVSSEPTDELDGKQALAVARAHWRCENEGHWTADAIFDEDARRTPWTQHPDGILVVGLLRAIAINILAVLRALSRLSGDDQWVKPTWKMVAEHALMTLFAPVLETGDFDAFDA